MQPRTPTTGPHGQRVAGKLEKVFLKATYKGKKDAKTFTLRDVDPSVITSSDDLKDLIKTCLHDDIKSGDFDVGYMPGTNVIRVRTEEDLKEMWADIKKSKSQCTTLWCDGLFDDESGKSGKSGRKRKQAASDDESDNEAHQSKKICKKKKVDNEAKVQEIVDSLKSKYGSKYTTFQLQIWAELISSGLYSSTDELLCNNSMFQRAGGGSTSKKKPDQEESGVAQAQTQAATAITHALTGTTKMAPPPPGHGASTSSPAKLIDS